MITEFSIVKFAFVLLIFVSATAQARAYGQCEKPTLNKDVFRTVSEEYREKLILRVGVFLQTKCEGNLGKLYEMMIGSFRESNRRDDFIKDMENYYSGDDRFVSFTPARVSEFRSAINDLVSFWFIEGCITEVINGKKRSTKTILEAYIEDGEILFTDITSRPNPLGNSQKCKSFAMLRARPSGSISLTETGDA